MRRLPGVLVGAAALALAVPTGAAQAATYRVTDPTGDVRNLVVEQDSPDFSSSPAPAGTGPDATGLVVRHDRWSVTVRVRVADLVRPTGEQALVAALLVRGSNGQRRYVQAVRLAQPSGPRTSVFRVSNGQDTCRGGGRSRFDYADDLVTVTVPRRCLGSPARIRASGYLVRGTDTSDEDSSGLTYDNLLETGGEADASGRRFTPWVARG